MDEDDDARRHEAVEIGVVAAEGGPRGLAESVADDLEQRFDGVPWRVVVRSAHAADPTADTQDLVDALRRRLLDEGWEIAIGITDLPLRAGRRPVVAHASAAHGVGLISVPALGALRREQRLVRAVVHLVEGLVGEHAGAADIRRDPQRARRMAARRELAAPVHEADAEDGSSVRSSAPSCAATCG